MAIPLTGESMRNVVTAALEAAFSEPDGWAVFADYHAEDMTWRITKVEPWTPLKHAGGDGFPGFVRIKEARDEIDAYMQAKKQLEQAE